jgi:hypothetical protein
MGYAIEQLNSDPDARAYAAMYRNWIGASGRR